MIYSAFTGPGNPGNDDDFTIQNNTRKNQILHAVEGNLRDQLLKQADSMGLMGDLMKQLQTSDLNQLHEIRRVYSEERRSYNRYLQRPKIAAVVGGVVGFLVGWLVPVATYEAGRSSLFGRDNLDD